MGFSNSIKEFTDILAWQESHKLMLMVYKETKNFPREELYSLTDQLKRASISVTQILQKDLEDFHTRRKLNFTT